MLCKRACTQVQPSEEMRKVAGPPQQLYARRSSSSGLAARNHFGPLAAVRQWALGVNDRSNWAHPAQD
eukprot:4129896-Alexandrium_andersonii.AAC.1